MLWLYAESWLLCISMPKVNANNLHWRTIPWGLEMISEPLVDVMTAADAACFWPRVIGAMAMGQPNSEGRDPVESKI